MTQDQAEDLIRKTEGRLCVRYYRREDGTMLTQNCPVGLEALKKRIARIATATISALLSFGAGFGLFSYFTSKKTQYPVMGSVAVSPNNNGHYVQGDVAIPKNVTPNVPANNSPSCSINQPVMGKIAIRPEVVPQGAAVKMGEMAISPKK